jgi:hypothetical protein
MNPLERAIRAADHQQQRRPGLAFAIGVLRKYGDDRGGSLGLIIGIVGVLWGSQGAIQIAVPPISHEVQTLVR